MVMLCRIRWVFRYWLKFSVDEELVSNVDVRVRVVIIRIRFSLLKIGINFLVCGLILNYSFMIVLKKCVLMYYFVGRVCMKLSVSFVYLFSFFLFRLAGLLIVIYFFMV